MKPEVTSAIKVIVEETVKIGQKKLNNFLDQITEGNKKHEQDDFSKFEKNPHAC